MDFFIKQNSTLPRLIYPISPKVLERFRIKKEMFENVAITFSMYDFGSGTYYIANKFAEIEINTDKLERGGSDVFILTYKFTEKQTKKSGVFIGEFVIDFLGEDGCGKLKLPISENLNIFIVPSITKTTVI